MAYTPKDNYDGVSFVTAEDFNGLKELLNNECNRRRGVGSVQSYAGAVYQFSTKPAPGGYILAEHGQKLADPLRAINPNGIDKVESGSYIRMDAMAKRIAELGKRTLSPERTRAVRHPAQDFAQAGAIPPVTAARGLA